MEDAKSILHDVEESCSTAVEILNDILLYDKIEDGRMELERSDVTAKKLVKSVADLFMVQVMKHMRFFHIMCIVCLFVLCFVCVCVIMCLTPLLW